MKSEEDRQAWFIIGMALIVCILLLTGAYFSVPPVQVLVPAVSSGAGSLSEQELPASDDPEMTGRVNINTATLTELETLPGIGPALAQRIVDYREQNGPFASVEDLLLVDGIGEKKLAALAEYATVG